MQYPPAMKGFSHIKSVLNQFVFIISQIDFYAHKYKKNPENKTNFAHVLIQSIFGLAINYNSWQCLIVLTNQWHRHVRMRSLVMMSGVLFALLQRGALNLTIDMLVAVHKLLPHVSLRQLVRNVYRIHFELVELRRRRRIIAFIVHLCQKKYIFKKINSLQIFCAFIEIHCPL